MKSVSILIATVLVAAAAFSTGPRVEAEVQCSQVMQSLGDCIICDESSTLLSVPCCPSPVIRNLKAMVQTPEDNRATCECVKQAATGGKYAQAAIKPEVAAQLLKLCAVDINVPISSKLLAQERSVEAGGRA